MISPDGGKRPGAVPLSSLPAGCRARLERVNAGAGLCARLLAMGLRRGADLHVVRNLGRGPFVVAVYGCRIVLGRGMADKILVVPSSGADAERPRGR